MLPQKKLKISIITAIFNNINTISESINSLRGQNYNSIESIWIDGCSTDGTKEFLDSNLLENNIYISEPDSGIYDALNKGLKLATGDIIGFLHADDIYSDPNILSLVSQVFLDDTVDAVYGDLQYVNRTDLSKVVRYWRSSNFIKSSLFYGWMPPHPTLFIRKEIYERFGGFNEKYKISSDYDFVLRIFSSKDLRAVYLPNTIINMRMGGVSNKSFSNILLKSYEDYMVLRSNNIGGLLTLFFKNFRKINQFFIN